MFLHFPSLNKEKASWLYSNSDLAFKAWNGLESSETISAHHIEWSILVCVEMLENEVLDYGERNKNIKSPNLVFTNAIIDSHVEDGADSDPEPSALSIHNERS